MDWLGLAVNIATAALASGGFHFLFKEAIKAKLKKEVESDLSRLRHELDIKKEIIKNDLQRDAYKTQLMVSNVHQIYPELASTLGRGASLFYPLFSHNGAKSWLEQAIEDKFNKKFAPHIANHSPAKAAVIVTLIKADIVTGHLSPLLLAMSPLGNIPVTLDNSLKTRCPGLGYAIAVRFQNRNGNLEIVKVAELN